MTATTIGTDKNALWATGLNNGDIIIAYNEVATGGAFFERSRLVLNNRDFFGTLKKEVVIEDFISLDNAGNDPLVSMYNADEAVIVTCNAVPLDNGNLLVLYGSYSVLLLNLVAGGLAREGTFELKAKLLNRNLDTIRTVTLESEVIRQSSSFNVIELIQYSFQPYAAQFTGGNIAITYSLQSTFGSVDDDTGQYVIYNKDLTSVVKARTTFYNPISSFSAECHAFSDNTMAFLYHEFEFEPGGTQKAKITYLDSTGTISQTITADSGLTAGEVKGVGGVVNADDDLFIVTDQNAGAGEDTTFVVYDKSGVKVTGPTVINGPTLEISARFPLLSLMDNSNIVLAFKNDATGSELTQYLILTKSGSTWTHGEQVTLGDSDDPEFLVIPTRMRFDGDNTFPPLRQSNVDSPTAIAWTKIVAGSSNDILKFEIIGNTLDFGSLSSGGGRYNSKLIAVGHQAVYVENI